MPILLMPIWYFAHAYLVFSSCLFGIWLMPILYLAHAYLVFGSCLFGIWLMLIYYIPTLISVMRIWHMRIFPSLKKRMSQGPAVYLILKVLA